MPTPDKPSSVVIENMRAEMQTFVNDVIAHGGGKVSTVAVAIGFSNGEVMQLVTPVPNTP
jgi:hypothetical protein